VILNHNGLLGLSAILVLKGWSSGFLASKIFEARGIEQYEIRVDLTEIGLNYIDEIIKVIFQVI
jgi:secreted Zn-dependent insulinase-like peptidase